MNQEMHEPTEEELQAALEEQMRTIRVEDVVLQSVATLVNLAGRRLGLAGEGEGKDVGQARLAIDAARALLPMCPEDQLDAIRQALSQLQMAFAQEAKSTVDSRQSTGPQGEGPAQGEESTGAQDEGRAQDDEAARAKARAKIWTPPGA